MQGRVAANVTEYIAHAPAWSRPGLRQLRKIVGAAAPDATEYISYGMPFYKLHGSLLGYAAYERHISLYGATAWGSAQKLKPYKTSKGTLQFARGTVLPTALIVELVHARVTSNRARAGRGRAYGRRT